MRKLGIPARSAVNKWMKMYKAFGQAGLERKFITETYPVQLKLDALGYKLRTDDSYQNIAMKFGILDHSVLANCPT